MLPNKKSYIVALALIAYGVVGFLMGWVDDVQAIEMVLGGGGLGALRAAIAKVQKGA